MFRMSAESHSPKKIATYLNESGVPLPHTRQNKTPLPWTPEKVRLVLQRRLYAGVISHGNKEYPGKHEALVSEAEWRAGRNGVQTHPTQTRRKSHPDICYPLPGLLHCPCCGRKMGVTYSSGKGTVHRYYTCVGRTGRRKDCEYPNSAAGELVGHLSHPALKATFRGRKVLRQSKGSTSSESSAFDLVFAPSAKKCRKRATKCPLRLDGGKLL